MHGVRFGIDLHLWGCIVPFHVLLGDRAASLDGLGTFCQPIRSVDACDFSMISDCLGDINVGHEPESIET